MQHTTKEKYPKKHKKRVASPKGKPRVDSHHIPNGVKQILTTLSPYLVKCIPETTACALIGMEWQVWEGYCVRYPALRLEVKRLRAQKLVEWQETVEAGSTGWQAAAVLLERQDSSNWSRNAPGRPSNSKSGYAQVVARKRGK